jgi:hypothetical protein
VLVGTRFYKFFDPSGPHYTRPGSINDNGMIVGHFEADGNTVDQGFALLY